ncbi:MAG: hypothetical protein N0C84_10460 [Candidatus Thiodiazotropha taylori]|uniref:Uncharacterized protein n=1 Tax=Candidatus Thiodiazotropha taylori TaxID=2792791 RepID=A0A9E4KBM7_9GAMM|nr:hypothetical protein [Candidatus Thiodiazotropha taylori]MCW4256872.1 hypothetical protein [Candidatus Thiodiazotropha taylori]
MLDEDEIKAHLETADRDYVIDVRIRAYDEAILLYIQRERIAPKVKKGFTSLRQIKNLQKHLGAHFSTTVDAIFVKSESHSDLEAGFFQLLNRRFNDRLKSFYISFADEKTIDSWIEVQGLDDLLKTQISKYFSDLLTGTDLILGDIQWISVKNNMPSTPALLRLIKTLQPVEVGALSESLKESYDSVDEKWLTKTLDNLRRKGLLHWQKPGSYTLTADSLAFVPAGTRRSSSDIDRALALGRRKW